MVGARKVGWMFKTSGDRLGIFMLKGRGRVRVCFEVLVRARGWRLGLIWGWRLGRGMVVVLVVSRGIVGRMSWSFEGSVGLLVVWWV